MALLSVALATARTYLNDDAAANWIDASLLPKAQEAHRELQARLWRVNSPAVQKESSAITVLAGAVTLGSDLPTDILAPFKLQEYANTVETRADAKDMTETIYLPNRAVSTKLVHWSWDQEIIRFVGCSVNRKVILFYRKSITVPTATSDPIGINFGELYIGARTAAMAHGAIGNKEAFTIISGVAETNFGLVVDAYRGGQATQQRP